MDDESGESMEPMEENYEYSLLLQTITTGTFNIQDYGEVSSFDTHRAESQ